ncbi:MAG: PadR family transcriptional regulator [Bryobacteraceae bacterium]
MECLTPAVFHILLALADGERHGYSIMREVAEHTNEQFVMGPGTLYGTLKRMLESQLIEECGERPDPALTEERRRYYRITKQGQRAAMGEASRLQTLVRVARRKYPLATSAFEERG